MIEKSLDCGNDKIREQFALSMTGEVVKSLIKNTYGFYVIQKLLSMIKDWKDLVFKVCMEIELNI